nr:HAMP domain-containing histidine kinase [Moraxellaceae bacterium]
TATMDKLRLSTTPLQNDIVLVLIEDLRREQTTAQQLKLASLGQLTASIAHEIRNPLAAISQASQLLMDEEDWGNDEDIEDKEIDPNMELYRMIFEQTKRVNRIIEDVLKLSRQAKPEQSKLDIVSWLKAFIDNYYDKHQVILHAKVTPHLYFDPNQLEQILINLVNNGLRFCRKTQAHTFVEIEVFLQKNDVILDVLDEGNGVPADKQDSLFMPFFTTDNDGTGLGLYLSQAFAEANFAQLIYVANHKKTCFRLIIPQAMSDKIE